MKKIVDTYQRQAILNASPTELITKLYDLAIQACYRKDEKRVVEVLSTLIRGLNFDYDIAGSLFNLYEYCQRQARKGEFDEVRELLEGIRDTWDEHVVKGSKKPDKGSFNHKG